MNTEKPEAQGTERPTDDAFEEAWAKYNAKGAAGGWERVAFICGFRAGWEAEKGPTSAPTETPQKARVRQYEQRIPCGKCGHVHLGSCSICNACEQIEPPKDNIALSDESLRRMYIERYGERPKGSYFRGLDWDHGLAVFINAKKG